MNKKLVFAIILIFIVVGMGYYLYNKDSKLELPNSKGDVVISEDSKGSKELKCTFYKLENDNTITEKSLEITDKKPIIALINYVFMDYATTADKAIINIPSGIEVLDYKIEMGTLILNLNKSVKEIKFVDMTVEEIFVKTLLKTIGSIPKNGEFQDVEFKVEGNSDNAVFGSYPTANPLKF